MDLNVSENFTFWVLKLMRSKFKFNSWSIDLKILIYMTSVQVFVQLVEFFKNPKLQDHGTALVMLSWFPLPRSLKHCSISLHFKSLKGQRFTKKSCKTFQKSWNLVNAFHAVVPEENRTNPHDDHVSFLSQAKKEIANKLMF